MSSLLALPLLWAQAGAGNSAAGDVPRWLRNTLLWLFLYGEPAFQTTGLLGGWLTWIKAISLAAVPSTPTTMLGPLAPSIASLL